MKFTLILAGLGLAAAAPGTKLIQRDTSPLVPRSTRRAFADSKPNQRIEALDENANVQYSGNWAGAVQIGNGYNKVQGTITVPRVTGSSGSAASAWVGIDGDTCQSAILQTGISFYADGSFDAWYEWIPDYSYSFSGFSVHVGDQIKMEVDASSKTAGIATLSNLTTGKKVSHSFTTPPSTLCETNAEWIVEAFQEGNSQVVLADFGTVTFTDASASGTGGTISPNGAQVLDISPDGGRTVYTDAEISNGQVSVRYTGN